MNNDFDAFLSSIKYLDREDILATAYKRHKMLDKSTTQYTTQDRLALQHSISGLLYWLEKDERPADMSDLDFEKLKPLCENLIRKQQLEASSLSLFGQ